jgi:uncharacterized protein YjaG (DUF416 family)
MSRTKDAFCSFDFDDDDLNEVLADEERYDFDFGFYPAVEAPENTPQAEADVSGYYADKGIRRARW